MTPDVTPAASSPTHEKRPPPPKDRRGGRTRRARDAAPFTSPARFSALVVALLVIGAFVLSVAISVGAVNVPLSTVWHSIAHHLGLTGPPGDLIEDQIVWDLRTPRALLAFVVGAGLAVAGTVIQAVVRNPLGDPYLLGIVPGASAGAMLVIVFGSDAAAGLSLGSAAFVGAMIAFVVTFTLSRQGGRWPATRLILAGVAVGYLLSSITFYLQSLATPNQLAGALFWTLGRSCWLIRLSVDRRSAWFLLVDLVCVHDRSRSSLVVPRPWMEHSDVDASPALARAE